MPPQPLAGHPERSAYGALAGKVEGRIVTWRDPTDPETFDRALDLALVAAVDGDRRAARDGFEAIRAGDWLVVVHELGSGARTMAGLDALSAEAARLGAPT